MACQFIMLWEAAPAIIVAVICSASSNGLPCSFVLKDQMEVCPLSRGMMLPERNSYPGHCSRAFACSIFLYPQPRQLSLRLAFPVTKEGYGLTTFRVCTVLMG